MLFTPPKGQGFISNGVNPSTLLPSTSLGTSGTGKTGLGAKYFEIAALRWQ